MSLEDESIEIIREAVATSQNPVMLYSIGKASSVFFPPAPKAFYPSPPPFPLLHVDTTWKFREMYQHRDNLAAISGIKIITYTNPEGLSENVNPFDHGTSYYTEVMKTQSLKQALDIYGFDMIFGGARRDEEKSRSKERIFSFRARGHRWDPKAQRPELWNLYNTQIKPNESIRVFPISNWTEADIWQYIADENIPIVPLYLAAERPVVNRDGKWIVVDDDRRPLMPGEKVEIRKVRFRTLGCWPLTAAIESDADTLEAVIKETINARSSERQGRLIDDDTPGSMEKKKQEGYF
jgi:sulfate adenylyltransferase subunit 2